MIYLVLAALTTASIVTALIIAAKRPYYHKHVTFPGIRVLLQALLKRGTDGGFLIIEDMKSEKFVQFAKYIKEKGNIGLESSFPRAPWSAEYYAKVEEFLRSEGIPFVIQPVDSSPVTEFIDIDCRTDIDLALRLVEGIFHNVFQIREPSFKGRGEGISDKDQLIDS